MRPVHYFSFFYLIPVLSALKLDGSETTINLASDQIIVLEPFTPQERNCLVLRGIMESLPSYNPVKTSVSSYFTSSINRSMKSFREIAIEVLQNIDYDDEQLRLDIAQKITMLREYKRLYHSRFLQNRPINFDQESRERTQLAAELDKLTASIKKLRNEVFVFNQREAASFDRVHTFAETNLDNAGQGSVAVLLTQYGLLSEFRGKASVFYQDPEATGEFKMYINQNFKQPKIDETVDQLVLFHLELTRLGDMLEAMEAYNEVAALYNPAKRAHSSKYDLMDANEVLEKIVTVRDSMGSVQAKINAKVKQLEATLEKEIKGIVGKLKSNKPYQAYIADIRFLKGAHRQKMEMLERLDALREEFDRLNAKYYSLDVQSDTHFTLAQDALEVLQEKLIALAARKQTFDRASTRQFTGEFKQLILPIMDEFYTLYSKLELEVNSRVNSLSEKLRLSTAIVEIEEALDTAFGAILARAQNQAAGATCFTMAQLSYIIFNMVKTNVIIREKAFLEAFLANQSYLRAKEFIVYNYRIFTTEHFILGQLGRDHSKVGLEAYTAHQRNKVIATYINNWSFLVNMYKEYTEFGTQSEDKALARVGLGSRLAKVLGVTASAVAGFTENTAYNEYFSGLATELLKMIPFFGNIPFLASIVTTILCYLSQFIIRLLVKFARLAAPAIQIFMQKMSRVFAAVGSSEVYDLNYFKYLGQFADDADEPAAPAKGKLAVQVQKIETKYFEAVQGEDNVKNLFDGLRLFDDNSKVVDPTRINSELLRQSLRQMVAENRLSAADAVIFTDNDEKYRALLQDRADITRKQNTISSMSLSSKSSKYMII